MNLTEIPFVNWLQQDDDGGYLTQPAKKLVEKLELQAQIYHPGRPRLTGLVEYYQKHQKHFEFDLFMEYIYSYSTLVISGPRKSFLSLPGMKLNYAEATDTP